MEVILLMGLYWPLLLWSAVRTARPLAGWLRAATYGLALWPPVLVAFIVLDDRTVAQIAPWVVGPLSLAVLALAALIWRRSDRRGFAMAIIIPFAAFLISAIA